MTLFILFGLFSIAAGMLLIFLIFMMLAAERRSEMGMARAVGMKRGHLIQMFIAEGTAYDLGAALIGAVLGVLVAFAIASVMGQPVRRRSSTITPHATWRSLVDRLRARCLGDVPDDHLRLGALQPAEHRRRHPRPAGRRRARVATSGRAGAGGADCRALAGIVAHDRLAARWNWSGTSFCCRSSCSIWLLRLLAYAVGWGADHRLVGAVFLLLGVSVTNYLHLLARPVGAGAWAGALPAPVPAGPAGLHDRRGVDAALLAAARRLAPRRVLPNVGDGGPEMFFLSGIFMVAYTTLIIMWNADLIVGSVALLGRSASRAGCRRSRPPSPTRWPRRAAPA